VISIFLFSAIRHPASGIRHLPSAICHLPSAIRLPSSVFRLPAFCLQIATAFRKRLQTAPESIFAAAGVSRLNHAIPLENNGRTCVTLLQFEPEF
jgi:hypothetical protein